MTHLGSVAVLTYMSRRSQRRRTTIRNDPFADLSEDSRRRRQRFHDQQSRERDEFAWFLEATFGWQSPGCHPSLARFTLARVSLTRASLARCILTRSQFGAFQFGAMPVWRVSLWRVSHFGVYVDPVQ